jgi:hypothetical protein
MRKAVNTKIHLISIVRPVIGLVQRTVSFFRILKAFRSFNKKRGVCKVGYILRNYRIMHTLQARKQLHLRPMQMNPRSLLPLATSSDFSCILETIVVASGRVIDSQLRLPSVTNCCGCRTGCRNSICMVRVCLPRNIAIGGDIDVLILNDSPGGKRDRYIP